MQDVFVIYHREQNRALSPIDPVTWATFPETRPRFGRDAYGNLVQNESRRSRLWHAAKLLRETIMDLLAKHTPGCCNSQILRGLDSKTWAIFKTWFDRSGIKYIQRTSTAKGYRNDTEWTAALQFEKTRSWEGFKATTVNHFKDITRALGDYWNLFCTRSLLKASAIVHESSHPYGDHDNVRAIVPVPPRDSSFASEDEAHLNHVELEYGLTPNKLENEGQVHVH